MKEKETRSKKAYNDRLETSEMFLKLSQRKKKIILFLCNEHFIMCLFFSFIILYISYVETIEEYIIMYMVAYIMMFVSIMNVFGRFTKSYINYIDYITSKEYKKNMKSVDEYREKFLNVDKILKYRNPMDKSIIFIIRCKDNKGKIEDYFMKCESDNEDFSSILKKEVGDGITVFSNKDNVIKLRDPNLLDVREFFR